MPKTHEKLKDKFRISSALKTIIGRELITDDFVAVFELVKNAFDAHAQNVEIRFEGLTTDSPKLIIQDWLQKGRQHARHAVFGGCPKCSKKTRL